ELMLRESEERYRLLFEAMPQPILVSDVRTNRILAANAAACDQYGYSLEEFASLTTVDLQIVGPAAMEEAPRRDNETIHLQSVQRRKDGRTFDAFLTCHRLQFHASPA